MKPMAKQLAITIATLGPIGTSLPAPGTFGSLTALIAGYFILSAGWFLYGSCHAHRAYCRGVGIKHL